ncbi:mother-specific HO expression [Ceratocystis pirilliformis]|uniref:Mother-specific HO expression n=1 Tax=Ceratocystis pirilliformis TaxID=259994 RepID=A0ABR3YQ75_9PEZI
MEILLVFVVLTFASFFSVSKPRLRLLRSSSLGESLKDGEKDSPPFSPQSPPPLPSLLPASPRSRSSHDTRRGTDSFAFSSTLSQTATGAFSNSMKQTLNVLSRKQSREPSPNPSSLLSSAPLPSASATLPSSSGSTPATAASGPSNMQTSTIAVISTANTTIRTVPSFEAVSPDSSSDEPSINTRNSAFSSSVNSTASMASSHGETNGHSTVNDKRGAAIPDKLKEPPSAPDSPGIPSENQYTLSPSAPNQHFPPHDNNSSRHDNTADSSQSDLNTVQGNNSDLLSADHTDTLCRPTSPSPPAAAEQSAEMGHPSKSNSANDPSWDSTIGKAGLGKTGRVINKLVSDNEALKRDIQIERLRAEEAKQAARMVEEKMERLISDYESRLLEANVTRTLLARKERQVESLTAAVELERAKSKDALGREKVWRDEVETLRQSSQVQVDEANNHAQLIEGRYNAIASHWKDQGDETMRAVTKMRSEIVDIASERRKDDDKINTLRELCDQQHSNIDELQRQKDEILAQFTAYKREQEDQLRDIKTLTDQREQHMEKLLLESKEALDKLRWALNVKKNVKDAQ